jgi:hypothetical protein
MRTNKLKLVLKGFLNNSLVENTRIVQSNGIVKDKINHYTKLFEACSA